MKTLAKLFYIGQIVFTAFGVLAWSFQTVRAMIQGVDGFIVICLFALVVIMYWLYGLSVKEYRDHIKRNKAN